MQTDECRLTLLFFLMQVSDKLRKMDQLWEDAPQSQSRSSKKGSRVSWANFIVSKRVWRYV